MTKKDTSSLLIHARPDVVAFWHPANNLHPNLLQLHWKYRKDGLGLDSVVNEFLSWAGVK